VSQRSERLHFALETRCAALRGRGVVHGTQRPELQRDAVAQRGVIVLAVLREVHLTHSSAAQALQQAVGAESPCIDARLNTEQAEPRQRCEARAQRRRLGRMGHEQCLEIGFGAGIEPLDALREERFELLLVSVLASSPFPRGVVFHEAHMD
jgi:hypothetical protein